MTAVLALFAGALAVLALIGGSPAAASTTVSTTLLDNGGDSAADGSGIIHITVGDTVLFCRANGFIFTVSLTPPGGGSRVQLPPGNKAGTSGRAYRFDSGGTYPFSWTAGDTARTFSGSVVVDDPSTNTPPPPPPTSDTPTHDPTSSQPTSDAPTTTGGTTPGGGGGTSVIGSSSASGTATGSGTPSSTGSATGTSTGRATTPVLGISFSTGANTSVPVNGFAGPGADPGTSGVGNLLPTTVNTVGDASTVAVSGGGTAPSATTAGPSTVSLTAHSTSRPTGLAIIAIAALAIVLAVFAHRRLSSRPLH